MVKWAQPFWTFKSSQLELDLKKDGQVWIRDIQSSYISKGCRKITSTTYYIECLDVEGKMVKKGGGRRLTRALWAATTRQGCLVWAPLYYLPTTSLLSLCIFSSLFCLWLRFSSNLPPNTVLVFSCSYFTPVKEKSCPSRSLELAQPGTSPSPPSPWYSEPHLRNKKSCLYSAGGKSSIFLPIIIYIFLVRLLLHIYILTLHKCVVLYWYWLALEV